MILSKSTAYGIRALSYLAQHPGRICGLQEIAEKLAIPQVYLGKVLGELRRHRLVASIKGLHGGYRLDFPPDSISFWDVFTILEPDPYVDQCLLTRGVCRPDAACEVHHEWEALRAQLIRFLQQKKISQINQSNASETERGFPGDSLNNNQDRRNELMSGEPDS